MDIPLPYSHGNIVPPQTPPWQVANTRPTNMSANPGTADNAFGHRKATITLSVHKQKDSEPAIRIKTFLDSAPYTTNNYPHNRVYQSTVWPEDLRLVQRVSLAIVLGDDHCTLADRKAMNNILAGLLNFLDGASAVEFLRIQLLDGHNLETAELVEVLQPLAIYARRMPDVPVKLVSISADLNNALLELRRSHSRSDDAVERFYSAARTAARSGARFHEAGLESRLLGLNRKIEIIMADIGFVEPGPVCSERLEAGIRRVQGVLELLLAGV